jgi:hypothetical protein
MASNAMREDYELSYLIVMSRESRSLSIQFPPFLTSSRTQIHKCRKYLLLSALLHDLLIYGISDVCLSQLYLLFLGIFFGFAVQSIRVKASHSFQFRASSLSPPLSPLVDTISLFRTTKEISSHTPKTPVAAVSKQKE